MSFFVLMKGCLWLLGLDHRTSRVFVDRVNGPSDAGGAESQSARTRTVHLEESMSIRL